MTANKKETRHEVLTLIEENKKAGIYTELTEDCATHISYYTERSYGNAITGQKMFSSYFRTYWYPEHFTENSILERMLWDAEVSRHFDIDRIAEMIECTVDRNALAVCNAIAFVWDGADGNSRVRDGLESEYSDEYAQYIGEDSCGITWVERQVIVINMRVIWEIANEMHQTGFELALGVMSTIYHEFRHLLYECNELIGDSYPEEGRIEENVEEYGNCCAENYVYEYKDIVREVS